LIFLDKGAWEGAHFAEAVNDIGPGMIDIVNLLIESINVQEPINTIVFLDKSARPVAFLLQQIYKELKKSSKVPEEFKLPQIVFFNPSGFYDTTSSIQKKIIKEFFSQADISGNVLIVDEVILTGSSSQFVKDALEDYKDDKGLSSMNIKVKAAFDSIPDWYSFNVSPVRDNPLYDFELHQIDSILENITDITFDVLLKHVKKNKQVFRDFLSFTETLLLSGDTSEKKITELTNWLQMNNIIFSKSSMKKILEDVNEFSDKINDPNSSVSHEYLDEYFSKAAGFLTNRTDKDFLTSDRVLYRRILKKCVQ